MPWRPECPIWIRVTRLAPVQTTWVHLHGSGSDHPRDGGGFRVFLRESIADTSPSESALENSRRERRRRRNGKALCFFIA